MNKKKVRFLSLARTAAKTADNKKGEDIRLLNVKKISTFAEYFLIITAESQPQINAISEEIKKDLNERFSLLPLHREGKYSESWAVLDYGGLVVHIMSPKTRQFYRIETLWKEARQISLANT